MRYEVRIRIAYKFFNLRGLLETPIACRLGGLLALGLRSIIHNPDLAIHVSLTKKTKRQEKSYKAENRKSYA